MPDELEFSDHAKIFSDVLFFSIGEGAVVVDARGKIARINQVALDILGYASEDLLGKWYPETVVALDEAGQVIPNLERPITEVFLTGQPVYKKISYRRADGSEVPVALTVSPIMWNNKPVGAIEIFRDITVEMELEKAKDEFISIASHQLRTPATVVKQCLGMILEGYVESDEARMKMIQTAYNSNDTQLNIITDLLKVAQIEANKLTINHVKTDLVALAKQIITNQQPEFDQRGIALKFKPRTKAATLLVDPLHIQMVLENLVGNANKYSPPDTTVTVEITECAGSICVHIHDQGIGIADKDISKLFKKFSRIENSDSNVGGTGLGLYWAGKLVQLYGGEIRVISKLGKGTTFTIELPKPDTDRATQNGV